MRIYQPADEYVHRLMLLDRTTGRTKWVAPFTFLGGGTVVGDSIFLFASYRWSELKPGPGLIARNAIVAYDMSRSQILWQYLTEASGEEIVTNDEVLIETSRLKRAPESITALDLKTGKATWVKPQPYWHADGHFQLDDGHIISDKTKETAQGTNSEYAIYDPRSKAQMGSVAFSGFKYPPNYVGTIGPGI